MRIAVLICNCGKQISKTIDLSLLAKKAKELDGVVTVKEFDLLCTKDGIEEMKKIAKEVDGIIIAGCSERLSLNLPEERIKMIFKEIKKDIGMFEVANIREQCAWLHKDKNAATSKAIDILNMAYVRLKSNKPRPDSIKIEKKVLVIGGGPAGLQAAYDLSKLGINVTLVEKKQYVGGELCKTAGLFQSPMFPGVCATECIGGEQSKKALSPNIKLLTNSEVTEIERRDGNFIVKIKKGAQYVDPEKCIACGKCSEVCPVETENKFELGMVKRKAIDLEFDRAVPQTYSIAEDVCKFKECGKCVEVCPTSAINLDAKPEIIEDKFGAVVIATGFKFYDLSKLEEYNTDIPDVISSLEMERLIARRGGRPSDGKAPHHITFVLCVGSRAEEWEEGVSYCSRTCCAYALKQIERLGLILPEARITVLHKNDVRSYAELEHFLTLAKNRMIEFINGRVTEITRENGKLKVKFTEIKDHTLEEEVGERTLDTDLVVLSPAQVPQTDQLLDILKIVRTKDGYPIEIQPRILRGTESSTDRVYVIGTLNAPRTAQESIEQGDVAAVKILDYLITGEKEVPKYVSVIDKDKCNLCRLCEVVCPHGAIKITEKEALVDPAFCQGCGLCMSVCPSHAAQLDNFSDKHILDQVDVAFSGVKNGDPKILALLCYWCSYAAADFAGVLKLKAPPNFRTIKIRCSSSVNSGLILEMFKRGVDGILIAGCPPQNCHHYWGNYLSAKRVELLRMLMKEMGLSRKRLRWEYIGAAKGAAERLVEALNAMDKDLRELGPNPLAKR